MVIPAAPSSGSSSASSAREERGVVRPTDARALPERGVPAAPASGGSRGVAREPLPRPRVCGAPLCRNRERTALSMALSASALGFRPRGETTPTQAAQVQSAESMPGTDARARVSRCAAGVAGVPSRVLT